VPSVEVQHTQKRCVSEQEFSLHAEVRCAMNQRKKLKQLCRYITRPAIADERLKRNSAGDVVLRLMSPYRDGTTHIVMSPLEFMQRLAALVPRPRLNLIRFHGVLAPNAKLRPQIIPGRPASVSDDLGEATHQPTPAHMSWARLAHKTAGSGFERRTPARRAKARDGFRKRVFNIDIEHYPHCGGTLKIIAAIENPAVIARILAHLGLPNRAPPRAPPRSLDLFETA